MGVIAVAAVVAVLVRTRHVRPSGTPVVRRDGGAAIRAPEGPHVPGTGVHLGGFVIDGAGLAVAGAEIAAEPEQGVPDRALAPAGAGSAQPVDAGARGDTGTVVGTPTGPDGRFMLDGLEPGRYRLRVTGPGLLAAEVRYVPVPSDAVRIVVARQVTIEGTVTDGGKPVASAQIGIRGDAIGGTIETKTDPQGAFHMPNLPEGRYQVYAWQSALAARTIRVNRLGAGPFPPVELRLEAGAIVVGRVVDRAEGTGLVAAIELRPSGDDQAPRYARSGEDGVFRIEGVPNGRWIADAFSPGYLSPSGLELEAGRGIPELALVRGGTIEGRILDADGNAIAGAAVRALTAGANPVEYSQQVDEDRLRRFSGRTSAPLPSSAGPAADPQFIARGELGVMVGAIPPIPLPGAQLAQPAALVDSTGLAGEPPPLPADPTRASIWTTGIDGRYRIRGVAKGKVTVLAQAPSFAEARSKPVSIAQGEVLSKVDIVLAAGTMIIGKVTDQHGAPVVGASLALQPEVGATIEGFADGDGEYKLGPVTGKVELRANAYGHVDVRRELELPPSKGTTPVEHREDIVLAAADAILAGTLDDETGATVSGAHLEVMGGGGEGRHAVVGADGTFMIEMLPPGRLRVRVEHPAYPIDELDAIASTTGERSRLKLPLGGGIEGAILDNASSAPIASISITASGPAAATAETTTDKDGRWKLFPLKTGHWRLEVKQPGYLTQTREVDVPKARTPGATSVRDIRIDLGRGALVGGTVRDSRGLRIANAHIIVKLANGSGAPVEGDTDAQGEFRLHDVPTGEISVTATSGDRGGSTRVTLRAGDEVLGLSIDVK
ncbi:MAG: hypothetical protein JWO36_5269 [Myxococcales bacterium]|nr:hypothetical protein [Myxococcales bacterium]